MNIVIAGGSGFLGRRLTTSLRERGDTVHVLTRRAVRDGDVVWSPTDGAGDWRRRVTDADAVVNLAGESIAKGRWTAERRRKLVDSRTISTRAIVDALRPAGRHAVLLNASAIGYYGDRGSELVTEASASGSDFLAGLCRRWEAEAARAEATRRVVYLRTGLVLDPAEGALASLLLPFRLGVGGPLGSGRQYWSWIHRDDWVRLTMFAIDHAAVIGPLNMSAPAPVTNAEFARTLGRVLRRPALLPTPAMALRFLLGEMADAMVLSGQRVTPARALALGFDFRFKTLESALADLLR